MFLVALCGVSYSVSLAQNDVYFIPSKKVNQVQVQNTQQNYDNLNTSYNNSESYSVQANPNTRSVDEYNRRSFVQSVIDDSLKLSTNVETDDINNFACTKKIIRFHTPTGVIISSPYYWEVCYDNTWDVYCDVWAYDLPSWHYWSYAFDPWVYNRWWYRTCWDFTWGWYDPWWGYSYWGWGRPAYWGWSRPWGAWGFAYHSYYRPTPHWGRSHGFEPGFGHRGGRDFARSNYVGGRAHQPGGFRVNNVRQGNSGAFASSRGRGLSKGFRMDNNTVQNGRNGGFSVNNNGSMNNGRRSYATTRNGNNGNVRNYNYDRNTQQNGGFQTNRSNTNTQQRNYEYNRSNSNTNSSRSYSGGSVGRSNSYGGGSSMGSSPRMGGGGVSRGGGSIGGGGGFSRGGGGFSHGGGGGHRR